MIENKHIRFLLSSVIVMIMLSMFYLWMFIYQLGSDVEADWWVKHAYIYKEYLARDIDEPKLIVISGSNTLFGLDSDMLEQELGMPVVNLSVYAGLGVEFMYYRIIDHLGRGDVVVMPLEVRQYAREDYTEVQVKNFIAWGWDDYLSRLSVFELLEFIANVPKRRILNGVIRQDGDNPLMSEAEVVKSIEEASDGRLSVWNGYDHKSMNRRGDILVDEPLDEKIARRQRNGIDYFKIEDVPSPKFVDFDRRLKRAIASRGASLIYTWPVMIRNKKNDYSLVESRDKARDFVASLSDKGIDVTCNPASFTYDVRFFFNTHYHTNVYGAEMRTGFLAECIRSLSDDRDYMTDAEFERAISEVTARESRRPMVSSEKGNS